MAVRSVRVKLVGPYPPPFGGVANHVKRLKLALGARGVDVSVLAKCDAPFPDPGVEHAKFGSWGVVRQLYSEKMDVIHFHSYEADYRNIARIGALALLGRRIVLTLHSFRDEPEVGSLRFRLSVPPALRAMSHVICVGPEVQREALRWGAVSGRTTVIPSYIPPVPNDGDRSQVPASVMAFLKTRRPIVSANAYRLVFFQGVDLYGLDLCVELCRSLVPDFPNLGVVFVVADVGDRRYFNVVRERIRESGLEHNFLLCQSAWEFWPILEGSSVMVRPTNTDSYGISVAEALDLGVPAVASDVCARPEGAILFRSRDVEDLEGKVRAVLGSTASPGRGSIPRPAPAATVDAIIEVYDRVSGLSRPAVRL